MMSSFTDHKGKRGRGRKPRWDKDFWREVRGCEVVPAAATMVTGTGCGDLKVRQRSQAFWPESLSTLWHTMRSRLWVFFFFQRAEKRGIFFKAFIGMQQKEGLRPSLCLAETDGDIKNEPHKSSPEPSGSERAGVSASPSTPRKRKQNPSVPLPHCPPNPAAAIAATTMPKRKKQNQQQPPPPQQPPLPERGETGDEEDGSPIGPPSLLGPPPMANGKPGDPKSAPNWNPPTCPPSVEWINKLLCVHAMGYYTAMKMNELLLQATWMNLTNTVLSERSQTEKNADSLHRGPPGSRGPMIPPLLSLPPPPRGRGPIRGGLGPRCGPYGRGWWGANTEPPFPGPGHGGPSRGGFHKEQRNPRRLKSWSLIKNTCPPKDGPQVMEDKSNRPVCRHFAKKGHCRYEDLCAFYHPGVNGPPL